MILVFGRFLFIINPYTDYVGTLQGVGFVVQGMLLVQSCKVMGRATETTLLLHRTPLRSMVYLLVALPDTHKTRNRKFQHPRNPSMRGNVAKKRPKI